MVQFRPQNKFNLDEELSKLIDRKPLGNWRVVFLGWGEVIVKAPDKYDALFIAADAFDWRGRVPVNCSVEIFSEDEEKFLAEIDGVLNFYASFEGDGESA